MMSVKNNQAIDYSIKEMVLLELDYAIGSFVLERMRRYLNEEQIKIYLRIPKDWFALAKYLIPDTGDTLMMFEMLAYVCPDDLLTMEYEVVLAYLSGLKAADWQGWCEEAGVDSISALLIQKVQVAQKDLTESYFSIPRMKDAIEKTAAHIEKVYSNPLYQESFWKWLDVFVQRHYLPWRQAQHMVMLSTRGRYEGVEMKGGRASLGKLLTMLPKTNALHYRTSLHAPIMNGDLKLTLWVEPFGLFDSWAVIGDELVISVSEPGELFSYAKDEITEIAERCKALSDPTRLGILRIIRHFDMDISEIAEYFGISRPTVSVHIKKLREAGLVNSIDDGRSTRHIVNMKRMQAMFAEIGDFLEVEPNRLPPKS
ncbi:MAG: winged helix-turn-helix transcriptional regulator [Anaerolineaceae bacterium]|nr:winged helix-turn-helix transcriptional regulator [Anaerolineaceae bacterium]